MKGRLGGIHRKVLDAIFAENVKTKAVEGGAHMFVIDPYHIARVAGVAAGQTRWFLGILKDMQQADVTIEDKTTGLHHWAHIISEVWESKRRADMPGGALTGDRPLYVVTVSAGWMKIYDTSMVVKYRNVLPVLSAIENGAVHAMALHILTHSAGSFDVADTLKTVGVPWDGISRRRQNKILQEIETEDLHLRELGIQLYRQTDTRRLMLSFHPAGTVHAQNPN